MRPVLIAAALLLATPALAHHDERHPSANLMAQSQASAPDSIQELQRQRRNPDVPPGVQAQRRDAADADAASLDDAAGQLRAAATALRAGRAGQANEFLERAESRLLTRSTLPARAGEAVQDGPIGRIAAARAALFRNDRALAQREIEAALTALDRPAPARRARP
ncbi:hypothetical protein [Sediminicoccus sp. KRV36]|uniref:hypothetical protein n=1 Tax=Sediminicoccus sp. KRV36 TaxID=3133721 RepID=UPI00200E5C01|nr:hypothetical protein [Sediminicoccus rosea]UPY36442.1 hypothetical protein LHU95_19815 [Sediminicoccus rosea]